MRGGYARPSSSSLCALFSGGKDSTYALHWAVLKGFTVSCTVTVKPSSSESYMFHVPYVDLTKIQSQAMGIPHVFYEQGEEDDVEALRSAIGRAVKLYGCTGLVTGALRSDYQRTRVALVADEYGLRVYNPLWWRDQESYLRELVRIGFRFIITSISVKGLSPRFLGKEIEATDVEEIIQSSRIHGFNPAFEGGEAETLVIDAPLYVKRLQVEGEPLRLEEFNWRFLIRKYALVDKN